MLQQEFPPEVAWFADLNIRVDLGYLGIKSDDLGDQIDIPTKKPRKSQKHPNPQLRDAQKRANKVLSQVRCLHRACDGWHEALQHLGTYFSQPHRAF